MSIRHALKWSFLSEIASKAIQPLVFVILARLLTPEDYGVVAAATMVISFSQIFWDAGMGKAIIQYQGERTAAANAAFWINNLLAVLVSGLLVAVSGIVSDKVFHDPRVVPVLQIMALQVVLSALVSVQTALLQKDLKFKHLFWVRLATVTVPGIISIPLAYYEFGYWALVAGTLVGQAVQTVTLWKTSPWKPNFKFDVSIASKLIRFGGWVAATGLLAWFYIWADSLIVGMYLGSSELGLYRTGNAFVMMLFGFVFGPLLPVFYSYYSGLQTDHAQLKNGLIRAMRAISLISIPLAVLLNVSAQPIADYIFGINWPGIGFAIGVLALTHGFAWLVGVNGEVYRVIGRPHLETWMMVFCLIFYIPVYLFAAKISLEVFLWARLIVVFPALVIHWLILWREDLNPSWPYFKTIIIFSLCLMLLAWFCDGSKENPLVCVVVATVWVAAVAWILMRTTILELFVYFKLLRAKNSR